MRSLSIFDLPYVEFYATHVLCIHKHILTDYHSTYQYNSALTSIQKIQPLFYTTTKPIFENGLYKNKNRTHYTNLLLWAKQSWLQYSFNQQTITVPSGGVVLVPKGAVYDITEPRLTSYIFTEFNLFEIGGEEISLGRHPTLLFERCPETVAQKFDALYNAFAGIEAKSAMHCNSILYQLLLNISDETRVTPQAKVEESILQVIAYLRRHYCETVSIKELCKISLLSSTQLRENFKKYTGCTMVEFKNKLRVENAKIQLLKTNLPVKVIAAQLGFENVFYFSKVFKQFTGVSPSEFKALHKEKT